MEALPARRQIYRDHKTLRISKEMKV